MKLSEKSLTCEACGSQMPIQTKGRMSRFCNPNCKNRGFRQRQRHKVAEAEALQRAGLALTLTPTDSELVVINRTQLDSIKQQARQLIEQDLRQLKQHGHDPTTERNLRILTDHINKVLNQLDQLTNQLSKPSPHNKQPHPRTPTRKTASPRNSRTGHMVGP